MNKHLYACHLLVLSSPTLMMHGHTNLKIPNEYQTPDDEQMLAKLYSRENVVKKRMNKLVCNLVLLMIRKTTRHFAYTATPTLIATH